jgi:hypothetical protein
MNKIRVNYLFIIIVFISLIFISVLANTWFARKDKEEPKLKITGPEDKKWYVRFSVKRQKTTAYVEETNAPLAASGQTYFTGGIAVHPRYPVQSGGDPVEPLLPFNTVIYLEKPIVIQGQKYTSLTVMDTGDVNYRLWNSYPYWFDVYFGPANYYNIKEAQAYGTPLVDYYWYEEWK